MQIEAPKSIGHVGITADSLMHGCVLTHAGQDRTRWSSTCTEAPQAIEMVFAVLRSARPAREVVTQVQAEYRMHNAIVERKAMQSQALHSMLLDPQPALPGTQTGQGQSQVSAVRVHPQTFGTCA